MPDFDLVIRGGTVATASAVFEADVAVRGERIVAIGQGLPAGAAEIDATGRLVLPGGVDSHCHIEQLTASGLDERRHVRERHPLGGVRRHHDGDPVRGPACRDEPDQGGRGLSCRGRARGGGRLRVPHDPVRPAAGGAGARSCRRWRGPAMARSRCSSPTTACGSRMRSSWTCWRRPGRTADGLRACRESRHDHLDGQAAPGRRLPCAALPRAVAPAARRGRGDRPGDRLRRAGRPAADDLPRQHGRGCRRDPPGARRGPQGLGRDLHAVSDLGRRRSRPAGPRWRDVDVLAALARARPTRKRCGGRWRSARCRRSPPTTRPTAWTPAASSPRARTHTSRRSPTACPGWSCACRCCSTPW